MKVENQFSADGENRDSELWWKITISPNKSFFPGFVKVLLRKIGFIKKNEYTYKDSIDVTTEDDVTIIRPKKDV